MKTYWAKTQYIISPLVTGTLNVHIVSYCLNTKSMIHYLVYDVIEKGY